MPAPLGYDASGSGQPLVLVHGFPLDRTMWTGQLEGLADTRQVIAVDLPGRGRSASISPDGLSIDDYADSVAATIDSLGLGAVDLAGLSMGGYVVFSLLRRHPTKVRSLLLIDTKAGDDTPEAKEGREKTAALVREQGTAALLDSLFLKLFSPATPDSIRDSVRLMFENTPSETAAADLLAMRDRIDSTPELATISIPTLVIHGEDDALMPVDIGSALAEAIPAATFVAVPSAGHMAPLENPEAVNAAIRDFLA